MFYFLFQLPYEFTQCPHIDLHEKLLKLYQGTNKKQSEVSMFAITHATNPESFWDCSEVNECIRVNKAPSIFEDCLFLKYYRSVTHGCMFVENLTKLFSNSSSGELFLW